MPLRKPSYAGFFFRFSSHRRAAPSPGKTPGIQEKGVRDAPDGHADAPLDGEAALSNSLVGLGLRAELLGGGRGVHADVNLSVDNVDVELGVAAEDGLESLLVGQRTGGGSGLLGKVGLEADAIDLDAVALDELDDALGAEGLIAVVLEVVVVVEELGLGRGLLGEAEGDGDEGLADGVVEDGRAVGAVLVQGLVDDVPARADVLVAAGDLKDVVLHDGDKGGVVKAALRDPCRELATFGAFRRHGEGRAGQSEGREQLSEMHRIGVASVADELETVPW
ncbi:hypothetical protein L1887_63490 [Cichorium endivia]|nr:hypothetical protein L1887_63490 [Cichorium endivia]